MDTVYMDNAATSYPKAPGTGEAIMNYVNNIGCNINRGAYSKAYEAERIVYDTRELLCRIFNFDIPENVIFTKNITESINVIIKGLLRKGDHVIVSSVEHNAVMRPLYYLNKIGVEVSKICCSNQGDLNVEDIEKNIKDNTKAVVMTHVSNVCGTIQPLEEVGKICRKHKLFFIVDSAQSAGLIDVNYKKLNADAIAFTGHKSLLGPQGIGGFIINEDINKNMSTFIEGGTGSFSEYEKQPEHMPDKFEAGTLNIPGIYGLNNSIKYIIETGIDYIMEKEMYLTGLFIDKMKNIDGVRIIGHNNLDKRTGVVSLYFECSDNADIAYKLSKHYGILTRCGLHCAPSAHKALGTFPNGTVRFSFSHFNNKAEIEYASEAIYKCIKNML